MPIVISVVNNKGGAGKTTTVFNLAHAIEFVLNKKLKRNDKILLIDNDPQGNLTSFFAHGSKELLQEETIYNVYDSPANYSSDIIFETRNPNIHFAGNVFLTSEREPHLMTSWTRYSRLKNFIDESCSDYKYVIIDNNPAVGVFYNNTLFASDYIIIPTFPTRLNLEGIKRILNGINEAKAEVNPNLKLMGVLLCNRDTRVKNQYIYKEMMMRDLGQLMLVTETTRSATIEDAEKKRLPITEFKSSKPYKKFIELAHEVLFKTGCKGVDFDVHVAIQANEE